MKFSLPILLLLLIGCASDHRRTVKEAEQWLAANRPDSALAVAHSLVRPDALSSPLMARYALLVAQAHLQRGDALSEDTLLLPAYRYYRDTESAEPERLHQATQLLAYHHWWAGAKEACYTLLAEAQTEAEARRDTTAVIDLYRQASELQMKDNDYQSARHSFARLTALDASPEMSLNYRVYNSVLSYFLKDTATVEQLAPTADMPLLTGRADTLLYYRHLSNYANINSSYGRQTQAISLQRQVIDYYQERDSAETAWGYLNLARFHLLQGHSTEAKQDMQLAERFATDAEHNDYSFAGAYQLTKGILEYDRSRNINTEEWAEFVNRLEQEEHHKLLTARAKEETAHLLARRNLQLTIERQHAQLIGTYAVGLLLLLLLTLLFYLQRRRRQLQEQEEELEALRRLVADSQQAQEESDERFFKKILLQQLGVIRMAAANPTAANQALLKRMTEITNKEVAVDSLLDWNTLYQSIDYIYNGFHRRLLDRHGSLLNEREVQLCCLLRARFSTKEISIVTQQSPRTIYQRKTTVRQKLGLEEKADIAEALAGEPLPDSL